MFGNVIYYDKEKIGEYKAMIDGKKNLEIEEYEISNDKGAKAGIRNLGANMNMARKYTAKVQESLLYNCDEFEKALKGRDDFFDFTSSTSFDITTMRRGTIIKFDGYINVPQEFDFTQTIDKFKPLIEEACIDDTMGQSEKEALKVFLETSNTKIPVLIELDEQLLCSKLVSNNMLIKYEDMEEYEELETTIIARIISGNMVKAEKAFYDPLKDFMTLNRAMRRSITDRTEGLNQLYADRDYRTIEILAIYQ